MNKIDNLLAALNKCETTKSHENVRYTLIDDELRSYIEDELERFKELRTAVEKELDILVDRRFDAFLLGNSEIHEALDEIIEDVIEELRGVLING